MTQKLNFTMPFEPMTIEHLGLRLYSTLPPVIGELVSNAYDAESQSVDVIVPTDTITATSEVIVRDCGHGLSVTEIQEQFLPIGRPRRGKDSSNIMSKNGKVRVTGRKGLGKLSAFGVAEEMEILFIQSGQACCLRLNYNAMRDWSEKHKDKPYEPEIVPSRCGKSDEADGVEVRLRKLHRRRAISEDELRRGLARRLHFIGMGFQVRVNSKPIQPGDRMNRNDCPASYSWDINDLPMKANVAGQSFVRGWIGFLEQSSQANRGIDIFANGKAAELGSFFNYPSTHIQYARAHLVGEIHADLLDGKEDLISTARNSVVWENEIGQQLQIWGQQAVKWAFDQWLDLRRKQKETEVITSVGFDKWLETRQPSEQRVAHRMVKLLIDDPSIAPDTAANLFEIVKSSIETRAFHELVDAIEIEGANVGTLLKLFDEWRVIEAREHLKLADGRLEAMNQLHGFIESGALEVQQMQPLFEKNPWLIDSAWGETESQTTYTGMLRKHCTEPKEYNDKDRRIDILGIRDGGGLTIVELKRPDKTLSRDDLEQIERYVDWARNHFFGTGPNAPKYIHGLLLVGKLSSHGDIQNKMQRLSGDDIRVETYGDLYTRASEYYNAVERTLEKIAPEYTRKSRKSKKKKE